VLRTGVNEEHSVHFFNFAEAGVTEGVKVPG